MLTFFFIYFVIIFLLHRGIAKQDTKKYFKLSYREQVTGDQKESRKPYGWLQVVAVETNNATMVHLQGI